MTKRIRGMLWGGMCVVWVGLTWLSVAYELDPRKPLVIVAGITLMLLLEDMEES